MRISSFQNSLSTHAEWPSAAVEHLVIMPNRKPVLVSFLPIYPLSLVPRSMLRQTTIRICDQRHPEDSACLSLRLLVLAHEAYAYLNSNLFTFRYDILYSLSQLQSLVC